jgi:DNA primase
MSKVAEGIKECLDLRETMEYYGIQFNRSGYAVCPFHNEKTASLSIQKKKNRFTCFGCGASGDVISFVMMYFNLDFGQALVRLNNDFQLGLTSEKPTAKSQELAKEKAVKRRQEKAEREHDRECYLIIAGAHAWLMRMGSDTSVLNEIEDWLDENIEMVVVR